MKIHNYNNKNCLDFLDDNNRVPNFTALIVATSGHGKGMSMEAIAERWKKTTSGVVINLNDPKQEAEGSFVKYKPKERYHIKELRKDGIMQNSYEVKMYHPFTFNLAKRGNLPEIEFFSISLKDLTREDWSILAETDGETETIKLLERVSEYIPRNASLFEFLLEVERLTDGKKNKGGSERDKKNWGLKGGGGTAKSVKQIGNMLSSFENDYFIRKDTCEIKLNFEKILLDPKPYHVFLTNWIENSKTRNFLVEFLLGQFVKTAQRLSDTGKLKTPILFLIPELNAVCPDEAKGSSLFLAKALRKHLVTFRSKGKGMSCIGDCQIWSQVHPAVRGAFIETFYGKLNSDDARIIFKAKSYTSSKRELFQEVEENYCSYVWDWKEDFGVVSIFMPSHMHKEEKYNWIQMWKKYNLPVKRYGTLVNAMRKEFLDEQSVIDEIVNKERIAKEKAKEKKEDKDKPEEVKISKEKIQDKAKDYLLKRCYELHEDGMKDREIARELGINHKTAKKYYLDYALTKEMIKDVHKVPVNDFNYESNKEGEDYALQNMLGEGVSLEEIETDVHPITE